MVPDGMAVTFRNLTQRGLVRAVWAVALGLIALAVSTSSLHGVFPELTSMYNCKVARVGGCSSVLCNDLLY